MEKLKECISQQITIDQKSMDDILSVFEVVTLQKGDYFIKSGSPCQQMAFINSGYMRMYDDVD